MKLLLDTHALLWWLAGEPLAPAATRAIADAGNLVAVSSASVWEIAIKASIGKLEVDDDIVLAIHDGRFEPLPVTIDHAAAVRALPHHHRDPFDRMLIAQARLEGLTIATRDPAFASYEVATLPV